MADCHQPKNKVLRLKLFYLVCGTIPKFARYAERLAGSGENSIMSHKADEYAEKLLRLEPEIRLSLERGFRFLKFSDILEKEFSKGHRMERERRYTFLGICALVLYNLFNFTDRVMLPDVADVAWKIRFLLVTPIMAGALILVRYRWFPRFTELVVGFLIFVTAASIILLLALSNHPNVVNYHTGIILIVIFGNIVVRLPFWHAFGLSWSIFGAFYLVVPYVTAMSSPQAINSCVVLATANIISLIGNYQMEREVRRDFLLTMLQQINAVKLRSANRQLRRLSVSDELTGLANRRHFDRCFGGEWRVAARQQYPISLIFIDIDHFKRYNDHYGHLAGDRCLQKLGEALKLSVQRPHDLAARYGGEEFVILLPHTTPAEALRVAEKIRQRVHALKIPHHYSTDAGVVTASFGVAGMVPSQSVHPEFLLKQADSALYEAKASGRNQVRLAADSIQAVDRSELA